MKVNSIRPDLPYVSNAKIADEKKETSKTADKLELSPEAINSQTILARIKSGFYDSHEVRDLVIEKILKEI